MDKKDSEGRGMDHFKGKQFQKDVIIVSVGYYLRYNLSGSVAKFENQTSPLSTQNILGWYSH